MPLKFSYAIADKPETCWRCYQLKRPAFGIKPGDDFVKIERPGENPMAACNDCFARLKEEVDGEDMDEGEEWKR